MQNEDFRFSVLLSIYSKDSPIFLSAALQSIVEQSLPPNEVVVVKDGPITPPLEDILKDFEQYLPIKYLIQNENLGLGNSLKAGLEICTFSLVARMDSDDIAVKTRFEKQIYFFRNFPNYDIVGSTIREFNQAPGDINLIRKVPEFDQAIKRYSKKRNPMNHMSVMFKKNAVMTSGSYESVLFFEDYYLWLKMIHKGYNFFNIQEPLMYVRVGNDMIGRRHGFSYLAHEINFFKTAMSHGLISKYQMCINIATRFPFRILPKSILTMSYKYLLR